MLSGQLKHRIRLQSKSVTRDSFGAETVVWTDEATLWAEIKPISGREYFLAHQIQSEVSHRIKIRYYEDVRVDWRILYGTRSFDILSVINTDEANKEMIIMAREFVT